MKNQVIEVLDRAHGGKVIEYWKSQGIDTLLMEGFNTKSHNTKNRYYGIINDTFGCFSIETVRDTSTEIIELPNASVDELTSEQMKRAIYLKSKGFGLEDRSFPKPMLVSMFPFGNLAYNVQARVVVAAGRGYAVGVDCCESLDDYIKLQNSNMLSYTLWRYYKEIPNKVIISKAEIAEKFGVPFDYIKIVD
jgi:hypothetical protein